MTLSQVESETTQRLAAEDAAVHRTACGACARTWLDGEPQKHAIGCRVIPTLIYQRLPFEVVR